MEQQSSENVPGATFGAEQLSSFIFGVRVYREDVAVLLYALLGGLVICGVFGIFLGYWFGFLAGARDQHSTETFSPQKSSLPRLESSIPSAPRLEQKKPTTITEV
jgi:hypothetical protein